MTAAIGHGTSRQLTGQTVVLSDIHFGVRECLLAMGGEGQKLSSKELEYRKKVVNLFTEYLSSLSDLKRIVLLGDVFDLQLAGMARAIEASEQFFKSLKHLSALEEVLYLPGNHDHFFWLLHIFGRSVIDELRGGGRPRGNFNICSDVDSNRNTFCDAESFLRQLIPDPLRLELRYPLLKAEAGDRRYLLTHGHFFDGQQTAFYGMLRSLYPAFATIMNLEKRELRPNLDELELYASPLYVMFTLLGHTTAGRRQMQEIYSKVERFKFGQCRDLDDKRLQKRIVTFVKDYAAQVPESADTYFDVLDFLVFGHTHQANVNQYHYLENRNLKVLNTGCWIESGETSRPSFVTIDANADFPKLMVMNGPEAPIEHAASQEMRDGRRPQKRSRFNISFL